MIVWVQWNTKKGSSMWPAKFEKLSKESRGGHRAHINYYQECNQMSGSFKIQLSKIELFFRSKNHFEFKKLTATMSSVNLYEFFTCYTKALLEHVNILKELEKNATAFRESIEWDFHRTTRFADGQRKENMYFVNGQNISLETVRELANAPKSQALLELERERAKYSDKLVNTITLPECKKFLEDILGEKIPCARSKTYLEATPFVRRKQLGFDSTGPLTPEDSVKVANFVQNLCQAHFDDGTYTLTNYEFDVLYPEACIWGIMRLDNSNYKKAELKCKNGFTQTKEEVTRQTCFEILNRLPKHENSPSQSCSQINEDTDMMFEDIDIAPRINCES